MPHDNLVTIDHELCTGCGLCTTVCPSRSIALVGNKARMITHDSISCGHCEAICPTRAIRVECLDDSMGTFATFQADKGWMPPGQFDTHGLVRLMASQRSCRNYSDEPISRDMLEDLVKIGISAPSGTNSQRWAFTVIPTHKGMQAFALHVAGFYRSLNKMAANPVLRTALKLVGKGELDDYYRNYYQKVHDGLVEWEKTGKDRLFHGATAAIIVSSRPGASCPAEDALLATQNILLAAHSMGLGTCLIGFAVVAMQKDPKIKKAAGIPSEESVHAVIALGYPLETYRVVTRRKPVTIRYFEAE